MGAGELLGTARPPPNIHAYLKELRSIRSLLSIDFQCFSKVITEDWRQVLRVRNSGCAIRRDQIQCLERVLVQVGWLSLNHF